MPPGEGIVVELVEETELSGAAGDADRPTRYRALVNCGRPVRDMTIEVRDESGNILPDQTVGKVWCTGPPLMPGSYRDHEAPAPCMAAGWHDTGHLGHKSGVFIYIVRPPKE